MTLDEFLNLIKKNVSEHDKPTSIRSFWMYCRNNALSVDEYIQHLLPSKNDITVSSILSAYGSSGPFEISRATSWLRQNKIPVMETLCGPCISTTSAEYLRAFLDSAIPAESEFNRYCLSCSIDPTPAFFANFRLCNNRNLHKSRFHPFSTELYFFLGSLDDLEKLFERWSVDVFAHEASTMEGYFSVRESSDVLGIKPDALLSWMWSHPDCWRLKSGRALIESSVVLSWHEQWMSAHSISGILVSKLEQLPGKFRSKTQDMIISFLAASRPEWIIPESTLPQQVHGVLYTSDLSLANQSIDEVIATLPVHPILILKEITNLSTKELKQKISAGIIDATEDENGNFYISRKELDRISAINQSFISLEAAVIDILNSNKSNFDLSKQADRQNLIEFCDKHQWWNASHIECNDHPLDGKRLGIAILCDDLPLLTAPLSLWMQCYRQPYSSQFTAIMSHYSGTYPKMIADLLRFEKAEHKADSALVDMVQLLFQVLSSELQKKDDPRIESELFPLFATKASTIAFTTLADFLLFGNYTSRRFLPSKGGSDIDISAYPFSAFSVMLRHIVDKDVILNDDLVGKALSFKPYADLWVYVALHFFASWRSTDYIRLHAPNLPYSAGEMLRRIRDNNLSANEAIEIAKFFIRQNELVMNTPNKTKGTSGVPQLYFHCPASFLEPFGRILSIATAHYDLTPQPKSFIVPTTDIFLIQSFFGNDFVEACDHKNFSGRRANKALLQSVEFAGLDAQLAPMIAYNLDTIMRSHKLSYGRPSESTAVYLKDAKFTGLTPEFIAYQMWDRGVCSFVIDTMMKECYGVQYSRLTVGQQTAVIKSLGLTPANAASLLSCIHHVEDQACETVMSVCQNTSTMKDALQAIALGHGLGKDPTTYCLLKAIGKQCAYRERASCLGCRMCISTMGLFSQLAMNHQSLLLSASKASGLEKKRLEYLCRSTTYPAIAEILSHLRSEEVDCEIQIYRKITEEVSNYDIADGCS